jgi:hypothetical protein
MRQILCRPEWPREQAVGQLQNSLNELRLAEPPAFDDAELRDDLRHLVEAQDVEITSELA